MADDTDDYDVGYGKPPRNTRWKKGQSGNPNGRPKGTKNFSTDLMEELGEMVQVTEGGNVQIISKQRALVKRTMEKALKGDLRAADLITRWASQYLEMEPEAGEIDKLSPDDAALLDRYIARKTSQGKLNNDQGGDPDVQE